jgi:hypothetical protein
MVSFNSVIDEAVKIISGNDLNRNSLAKELMQFKDSLVFKIPEISVNECIGGVDSGFVSQKLAFLDLILIRCVGVVFHYETSALKKAEYVPGFFEFPKPYLINKVLEEDELNISKSLMRLKEEVQMAKKLIEEKKCKYVFLDGSIVPQYQDKPRSESEINSDYKSIISEFVSLYELAEKHECTLIGFVEDSRGSRFCGMLSEKTSLPEIRFNGLMDSFLLDSFLSKGEATIPFTYSKNILNHAIMKDFPKEWSEKVHAMYLKAVEFDKPLRIEFLSSKEKLKENAELLAGIAFNLSSMHKEYAYPAPLIEADLRAKLKPEEISTVYNKIQDKLSKNIKLKLRRNSRPF